MTLAASSDRDRERTIVIFTDVNKFNEVLEIPGTDEVQLFLLDADNEIQWRGSGAFQYDTLHALENRLDELKE
jgi:hypothetical protein